MVGDRIPVTLDRQKYGLKYVINGIVKGHINEIVHCGFII